MSETLRCRVCREEFVVCETSDDDPICVWCYNNTIKPYEVEIARLRAEVERLQKKLKVFVEWDETPDECLDIRHRDLNNRLDKAEAVVRVVEEPHKDCPYQEDTVPQCSLCAALAAYRGRA